MFANIATFGSLTGGLQNAAVSTLQGEQAQLLANPLPTNTNKSDLVQHSTPTPASAPPTSTSTTTVSTKDSIESLKTETQLTTESESTGAFAEGYLGKFINKKVDKAEEKMIKEDGDKKGKEMKGRQTAKRRSSESASVKEQQKTVNSSTTSSSCPKAASEVEVSAFASNSVTVAAYAFLEAENIEFQDKNGKNFTEEKKSLMLKHRSSAMNRRRFSRRAFSSPRTLNNSPFGGRSVSGGSHSRPPRDGFPPCRYCDNDTPDHMPTNCPKKKCSRCRQIGHPTRKCPNNVPIECFVCCGTGHVSRECTLNLEGVSLSHPRERRALVSRQGSIAKNPFNAGSKGFDASTTASGPFSTIGRFGGGLSTALATASDEKSTEPKRYGQLFNRSVWDSINNEKGQSPQHDIPAYTNAASPFESSARQQSNPFAYEQMTGSKAAAGLNFEAPRLSSSSVPPQANLTPLPVSTAIDNCSLPSFEEFMQWRFQQLSRTPNNAIANIQQQESLNEYRQFGQAWVEAQVKRAVATANNTVSSVFNSAQGNNYQFMQSKTAFAQSQTQPSLMASPHRNAQLFTPSTQQNNANVTLNAAAQTREFPMQTHQQINNGLTQQPLVQCGPSSEESPLSISYYGCGASQWMTIVLKPPRVQALSSAPHTPSVPTLTPSQVPSSISLLSAAPSMQSQSSFHFPS